MSDNIKVSVVIPIYNGEQDLPDLIECLYSQTYPQEQVEYLLVDNNSSDRTGAILGESQTIAQSKNINLKHLSEPEIQSSYAARNQGIKQAKGAIIAFTDADCRPKPEWLEELIKPFSDPLVGIVAGEIIALPGTTLLEKYAESYQLLSQKPVIENSFCPYGQTANLAIKREAFLGVGLFRPYLTTGGDADMCWRIQRQSNWQLKFAPLAIISHRHRSNLKNFRSQWRRYGLSSRYLHELHGSNLMRELTFKEFCYRLIRWLLKEIPKNIGKLLTGQAHLVDFITTPIDLIGFQAKSGGQKTAQLPELARQIEWLQPASNSQQKSPC